MSDFPSEDKDPTPDVIDQASALSEGERQRNARAIQNRAAPKQVINQDGSWPVTDCEECGLPIGLGRIEAIGAVTCISCASFNEHREQQYARNR